MCTLRNRVVFEAYTSTDVESVVFVRAIPWAVRSWPRTSRDRSELRPTRLLIRVTAGQATALQLFTIDEYICLVSSVKNPQQHIARPESAS
jgi:hypothetical protein